MEILSIEIRSLPFQQLMITFPNLTMLTFKCSLRDRPAIAIKINNWKTSKKNTLTCKLNLSYVCDCQSEVDHSRKETTIFEHLSNKTRRSRSQLLTEFNSFFVHDEVIKECPKQRPYCERPLVLNRKESINSK